MTKDTGTAYRGRTSAVFYHFFFLVSLVFLAMAGPENAMSATHPVAGEDPIVLLTIRTTGGEDISDFVYTFTRSALESLPQQTIKTKTPWTDGIPEFSGPLISSVLSAAGRLGRILRCVAINDYAVDIPIEDIERSGAILAMKQDGKIMSTREKGPLWVIFPWSDNPALWTESYFIRSIWQLEEIELLQ
jgi:hypothetical protein